MVNTLSRVHYADPNNRLSGVRVSGLDMSSDITSAVTAASMSFSSTQVGQFSMTLADTGDAHLLASGMFGPSTTIDWGNQHLKVRTIDFSRGPGGPELKINARSRVIAALRDQTGKASWGTQDAAKWVRARCAEVGAVPLVQDGLGTLQFARQQTEGTVESTWDVMTAAARNVGAWCYECEQIITFMRPTALVNAGRARSWDLRWDGISDYSAGMTGFPEGYSWTADSDPPGEESLTLDLTSADADYARPGDRLTLHGRTGMATGLWVLTDVTLPVSTTKPVRITCARAKDPPVVAQNLT